MPSRYGRAVSGFLLLCSSLCSGGAARVQDGPLMVANFDGGHVETVQGLALVVIADEQLGGMSEARLTVIHPGAEGSRGGARISFRIADGFATPFAGVWALLGAEGLATDLSTYRGLRFHARSKDGSFLAGVGQFAGQAMLYMAPFDVRPEWTVVDLPFDKFRRAAPTGAPVGADGPASALVPKSVTSIGFSVSGKLRGQFDLEIDQVQLYR